MKTERKIFKNTLLLSSGKVFGDLCSFIFLAYFGRIFGAATLGKYSFAMSLAGLLTVFASLGFNSLMLREVSKDESKSMKYVGNLLVVRAGFSVLIWMIISLVSYFSNFPSDTKVILILICGYQLFYRLTGLVRSSFNAHDRMHYSAILEFYHKIFILVFGVGSILFFNNPVMTLGAYPLSASTMFIAAMIIYLIKFGRPVFALDFSFIKASVIKGFPFFFIIIIGQIYDRIGIILLTLLNGESVAGLFSASDRILVTLNAGAIIFGGVLLPYMSKLSAQSQAQLYKLSERSMRVMYVIFLTLALIVFILSEKIILLTFGNQFLESIKILQILVWSLLFMGLNHIIANLLIVSYKEKKLLKIRILAYLLYCAMSFILIWRWGVIGLAWAKIVIEAALFFTTIFYAFEKKIVYKLLRQMLVPLTSCILSVLLYFVLQGQDFWLTFSAVFSLYLATMFLFKGILIHDFHYLREIVFHRGLKKS